MTCRHVARITACKLVVVWLLVICFQLPCESAVAQRRMRDVELEGRSFSLPEDLELELAAKPPLIERPIHAAFDERGRLYVTESSGTNDPVATQLKEKPHRIWRLSDTDDDGVFDERTLFADNMMFPEGALWFRGSLYVTAPPQIWKLTDRDDDGRADHREVWFDGKTLTHCANDLHGPFLGRDGRFYWCKGAFAEQSYERPDGSNWSTRASHIFRCRPDGRDFEAVMTGGMDNPVEVVFTWSGERIFNTTFLQHPANGKRDGLIHAIYGGLYGKSHGVLEGHPRTGPLMPVMTHLGAAAPSGLAMLESESRGSLVRGTLLVTLFNMHKVTQHALVKDDASFTTVNADLLVCDDLDFHPTDVLEDADGSVLVIDTGGWYKLCCPTSQLWKPDVTGAIYRIKSNQVEKQFDDPRGLKLDWNDATSKILVQRLFDRRPAVRFRAMDELALRGPDSVPALERAWRQSIPSFLRLHVIWTLTRIDSPAARSLVQSALFEEDPAVRQAALHSISLWRDRTAKYSVAAALRDREAPVRRAAAEAIGRIGDRSHVGELLKQLETDLPRIREHSLIYALIEIGASEDTRKGLASKSPRVRKAALIALDQMRNSDLTRDDVLPLLEDPARRVREAAWDVAQRRQWGAEVVASRLRRVAETDSPLADQEWQELLQRVSQTVNQSAVQTALSNVLDRRSLPARYRIEIARLAASSRLLKLPSQWEDWVIQELQAESPDKALVESIVDLLRSVKELPRSIELLKEIGQLTTLETLPVAARLKATEIRLAMEGRITDEEFDLACRSLVFASPAPHRSIASGIVTQATTDARIESLIRVIPEVTAVELSVIIDALDEVAAKPQQERLYASLMRQPATRSLDAERIKRLFDNAEPELADGVARLLSEIESIDQERLDRIRRVERLIESGDVRRGQEIFHGSKAACASCHALGYLGGDIGPDLTRIGGIRSERDLLESILMPSATFVRSYEPTTIITIDGRVFTGVIRNETERYVELVINQEKTERVYRNRIEERQPGAVSIMPAGLDEQFTDQELADIVKFLKEAR